MDTKPFRLRLYEIIFEADTPEGRSFDIALLVAIVLSVIAVSLDSVADIRMRYGGWLNAVEWFFTILFTIEYVLRLWTVQRPMAFVFSPFGIIDLLAIMPNYLSLIFPGMEFLVVIRVLRILRIFRIFKLAHFLREGNRLTRALYASRVKIMVFLLFILLVTTVFGTLIYVIEYQHNDQFSNIPSSIYWAIVTLTTVGYGDISPVTDLGRMLAALVMMLGYSILAVPTGIVTAEIIRQKDLPPVSTQVCPHCAREGHDFDAVYCKYCGELINP